MKLGADPSKMNIGMGLYGRSFTLTSASNSDVGDPVSSGGQAGQFTRESGFLAYYEVRTSLRVSDLSFFLSFFFFFFFFLSSSSSSALI